MVRLLESSVHKSAYSGPINMIPSAKWVCYVLPIYVACSIMQIRPLVPKIQQDLLCPADPRCMFNHANKTIGSQVTAGDWVVWSVGSLVSFSVSSVTLFMFIVPLIPALFANRLLADQTSHRRGSACLPPLLCTQFSSELLSVTHPAITPRFHPKTHPHVGTLICHHTCSHLYSTVTFAFFVGGCAIPVVIPFLFHQPITNLNRSTICLLIFVATVNLVCKHNSRDSTTNA